MSVQLQRAIDILELIEQTDGPVSLGDIALRLDLPKSAAHRLLQVWLERGYIEQDATSQRYSATLKLAVLGFAHLNATGIRDVCYPDMRLLARETGELARLAVIDGDTLTWAAEAQGARDGLRYDGNIGRQALLYTTAAGKAWLAALDNEEAMRLVLAQGFPDGKRSGPRALHSMRELLDDLERTRARGYATAIEEAAVGVNAVAAAVYESAGSRTCVGALIIVGPSARLTPARIDEVAPLLSAASARISSLWPIRRHMANDLGPQGVA
ncbi:MAG: IclR family transcriptional regulator [Devosia sp.]